MELHGIQICCLQEVRKPNSDYYVTELGYTVILSGTSNVTHEWAGVGFVLCPSLRGRFEFLQLSSRIASIKLHTQGGKFSLTTAYAPHNLADTDDKLRFYEALEAHLASFSVNGARIIAGDFNARLGRKRPHEDHILGEYGYGREAVHPVPIPNVIRTFN